MFQFWRTFRFFKLNEDKNQQIWNLVHFRECFLMYAACLYLIYFWTLSKFKDVHAKQQLNHQQFVSAHFDSLYSASQHVYGNLDL